MIQTATTAGAEGVAARGDMSAGGVWTQAGPPAAEAAPTQPSRPATARAQRRDALVFVPGFSRSWGDQALEAVAKSIAVALDRETNGPNFHTGPLQETGVGKSRRRCAVVNVVGGVDGTDVPVLDVFGVDYRSTLVDPFERSAMLKRAVLVFLAIVANSPRVLQVFRLMLKPKRLGGPQFAQIFIVMSGLLLYTFLLGVLVVGLFSAAGAVVLFGTGTSAQAGPWTAWIIQPLAGLGTILASIWAFVWAFLPPKSAVKESLTNAATDLLAMDKYLGAGVGRREFEGRLESLIDDLRDEPTYRHIHVAGYSFGSILVLNTLFPVGRAPSSRSALTEINTLITIGCPYDLLRSYWPSYFRNRRANRGSPHYWLNLWSPTDVLATNFDDNPFDQSIESSVSGSDGTTPVKPINRLTPGARVNVGLLELVTLAGLREHGGYWGTGGDETVAGDEKSCFDEIISWMVEEGPAVPSIHARTRRQHP